MAMKDGGYDVDIVNEADDDLFCVICSLLMRDAVELQCGHGMCDSCLKKLLHSFEERNVQPQCPHCRKEFSKESARPVMMFRRLILNLKIKCIKISNGCEWIGELSGLQDHLDKTCLHQEVKCPFLGCNENAVRWKLEQHKNICQHRTVLCNYCSDEIVFKMTRVHLDECDLYPTSCPNNCGIEVPRCEVDDHLTLCPLETISCSFQDIGCDAKICRKDMDAHNSDFMQQHMFILLNDYGKTKERASRQEKQLTATKIKLQETQEKLQAHMIATQTQFQESQSCNEIKLGALQAELSETKSKYEDMQKAFNDFNLKRGKMRKHDSFQEDDNVFNWQAQFLENQSWSEIKLGVLQAGLSETNDNVFNLQATIQQYREMGSNVKVWKIIYPSNLTNDYGHCYFTNGLLTVNLKNAITKPPQIINQFRKESLELKWNLFGHRCTKNLDYLTTQGYAVDNIIYMLLHFR